MTVLDRRLQILLDQERYERVSAEAERRGGSVAAVIRDAIDVAFPNPALSRAFAVRELLAHVADEPADLDDKAWAETRAAMDADVAGRFA